jgi:hypothetical protein
VASPQPSHLQALAAIRERLAAQRQAEAAAVRQEAERLHALTRERDLFVMAVGQVMPLRKAAAPVVARPRPAARARQRERDEAAVLDESISDEFDVESLLETDEALAFRRRDIGPDVVRKLRRGVWALQGQLDLLGEIPIDPDVREAVFRRCLLLDSTPGCAAAQAVNGVARRLAG